MAQGLWDEPLAAPSFNTLSHLLRCQQAWLPAIPTQTASGFQQNGDRCCYEQGYREQEAEAISHKRQAQPKP